MPFDSDTLYQLLPAYYRSRDAAPTTHGSESALKELLALIAESIAALEDDLEQMYDDQFIETCAEWVIPYIGELIAYRPLDTLAGADLPPAVKRQLSERSQVANTLRYRRRKGSLAVIEDLASDVTGWEAVAVEFFKRMALTQHLNHIRPACHLANLRTLPGRAAIDSPFDATAHAAELRPIKTQDGRYNLPNVGIFLWRLRALSISGQPATAVDSVNHPHYFRFCPLGADLALFAAPQPESEVTHLADPDNVPAPITRRRLHDNLGDQDGRPALYGPAGSILLRIDDQDVPASEIVAADLSEDPQTGAWAHHPKDRFAVDPVLGRITSPSDDPAPARLEVSYRFGAPSAIGSVLAEVALLPLPAGTITVRVPQDHRLLSDALQQLDGISSGEALIDDFDTHSLPILPELSGDQHLAIRAVAGRRPHLQLTEDWQLSGGPGSKIFLEGLLISSGVLVIPRNNPGINAANQLGRIHLRGCTLVPGISLKPDGNPTSPGTPGLVVDAPGVTLVAENCILGGLRVHPDARVFLKNCVIDAGDSAAVAYAEPSKELAGGSLSAENCTFIGRVHALSLEQVENTIFLSRFDAGGGWGDVSPAAGQNSPVRIERRQIGCLQHTFVPWGSRTPRREACHPANKAEAVWLWPRFASLRYGEAGYALLSTDNPMEIWQGGRDQASIGAFHDLYEPQRLANLRIRLEEYLRFGMQAGIFTVP